MADMVVRLENQLSEAVHVAAVKHSGTALEFVVSRTRVPIPSGEVRHFDIDPGYALQLKNVPLDMQFSLSLRDWGDSIMRVAHEQGFEDGAPYMVIRLLPPEDEAPADPTVLN